MLQFVQKARNKLKAVFNAELETFHGVAIRSARAVYE